MDYKSAVPVLKMAVRDPNVPPDIRRKLLLLRAVVMAVPFWSRRRVWDRLWNFISAMALEELEEDADDVD